MNGKSYTIELTALQLSHATVAVQKYMHDLMKKADEDPEGGEHEDYLIAQSILNVLTTSKRAQNE